MRITIINGPNLNLLGKRNPAVYGTKSFETYLDELRDDFPGVRLTYFQSNHEGELIDRLHKSGFNDGGIILNGGGLSHTSIALRDAVEAIPAPVVEVHISDIYARESFRHHSYLKDVCKKSFIGMGLSGYARAIEYLTNQA
jgi:3-dehydroquinate dehydratase-2